jgi:major membrane immunogen (membrane-anchored lipoprotein)
MRALSLIPVLASALLLAGCETMSKEACLQGDWSAVGFKDGEAGRPQSRLDDHAKACAKAGVSPDPGPYFAARDQGLKLYCTPQRGFQEGRYGNSYAGVCPERSAGGFLVAYADGKLVHAAVSRLSQAESERGSADARAEKRDREARGVEDELKNPKLNDEQKKELRDRLNRLRSERRDAVEAGRRAEWARREAERDVAELQHRFAPIYGGW